MYKNIFKAKPKAKATGGVATPAASVEAEEEGVEAEEEGVKAEEEEMEKVRCVMVMYMKHWQEEWRPTGGRRRGRGSWKTLRRRP